MAKDTNTPGPIRAAYIGPDSTHSTVIKRITAFMGVGVDVLGFTFRRKVFNADYQPEWRNVDLGQTVKRNYFARIPKLLKALSIIRKHREELRTIDYLYARNFDNVMLAIAVKLSLRLKAPLVYEIPDVQAVFFDKGWKGRFFRAVERWALSRIDLLVVSSPGYLTGYFEPVQKYRGRSFVLENKMFGPPSGPENVQERWRSERDRWIVSWYGTLRCPKCMELLGRLADLMGDKVLIYLRGYPAETGFGPFNAFVDSRPNIVYEGEYKAPTDLAEIYGRAHFAWCFDFLDEAGNSPLLLPNRIYQGGYFGVVPLAAETTETGAYMMRNGLGYTFSEPYPENVAKLLSELTWEEYERARDKVVENRDVLFVDDGSDMRALVETIVSGTVAPGGAGRSAVGTAAPSSQT